MKRNHLLLVFFLLLTLTFPLSGFSSSGGSDVTALITNLTTEVWQNGIQVADGEPLTGDPVNVTVRFSVPVKFDEFDPGPYVEKGDSVSFELSSGFFLTSPASFVLKSGGYTIGHVTFTTETDSITGVKTTTARVDFDGDDAVYNGTLGFDLLTVQFNADMAFDASAGGGGSGSYDVQILGKNYTVVIPPEEAVYDIQKSGAVDFENRLVTWGPPQSPQPRRVCRWTLKIMCFRMT